MASDITLYHFTCQEYLSDILVDGFLEPGESLMSKDRDRAGRDVVWLTTSSVPPLVSRSSYSDHDEDAASRMDQPGSQFDKTAIRFTVKLHKRSVHPWRSWARSQGIDPAWAGTIAENGVDVRSWWVSEKPVLRERWTEILDLRTGQVYLSAGANGFEYSRPLSYDFEPQYTQSDIDAAYRAMLYEKGERFDVPPEWLSGGHD